MEIEVGEYIRIKKGIIGKVEHIIGSCKFRTTTGHISKSQDHYYIDNPKQRGNISKLSITKHSKNIIDLIEEGDYVNGYLVVGISDNVGTTEKDIIIKIPYEKIYNKHTLNEDIETIVTKEQFKEMEYKVE